MPIIETTNFGPVEYQRGSALEFPRGLPGFESRRRFLPLRFPSSDPLIYLQSVEDPALCFITMPVLAIEPEYRLEAEAEDLALVGLREGVPRIGDEALCLAVVSAREEGPTANLLAPLVINPRNRKGVQAVVSGSGYSHQQPLHAEEAV